MTINKVQGQPLKGVGRNLSGDVFSHGQLYVGRSRVGNGDGLYYYSSRPDVKNVVCP